MSPEKLTAEVKLETAKRVVEHSLDPVDWKSFRGQAHRMLDDMLDHIETLRQRPVWQVIPDEKRERFVGTLPSQGTALSEVHGEFMRSILPYSVGNAHPGFMGWVQGGGTPVGMMAEMLAAGLNANVGGRDQIPLEVERQVVGWMRDLFGFPEGASGLFVAGTSIANLVAVVVARHAKMNGDDRIRGNTPGLTAYASEAVHGSLRKAFEMAGLGSESLRQVPVDERQRIDLEALKANISEDRAAGYTPFFVAGTAGTVDTGAIDDLSALAEICEREELWFHVDGAYGALAMLVPEMANRLRGIERADSLAFDFHKWAQVPYDSGFVLFRDGEQHCQAFESRCSYLMREDRGMSAGSPWPCDLGPELSRGFRALKVWMAFKVYGAEAIGVVVRESCGLARHLEALVNGSPELELMASVELNIVCFRYRFEGTEEESNGLTRQIVVALQEGGKVAPSTTLIGKRIAIRAAIVNHRTTSAEIETLVEEVLAAGRRLKPVQVHESAETVVWQPWIERETRVKEIDALLQHESELAVEVELRVEKATLLAQMGMKLEARTEHLRALELDQTHLANLIGLGGLLQQAGQRKAAEVVYTEAVRHHPRDIVSLLNLGSTLLEGDDPAGARTHYEAALAVNPEFAQAHGGMYYALDRLGETEAAEWHRRKAFGKLNCFPGIFRGTGEPIPIILLVSSNGGNTPIEKLLDDTVFQTTVVVADFYDPKMPLPEHRLIMNGIGDADLADDALRAAEALIARTTAPVLNMPSAVRVSGRCENASRLRNLPGVVTAATQAFPYAALASETGAAELERAGFTLPLLLRAPGFHMGQHFIRVDTAESLAAAIAGLPGSTRSDAQLLAIQYLDANGADGCARKYRVMIVAGKIYPLHLAISSSWKIHYFSADMADRPDHREEEMRFLTSMPEVLGERAMQGLEEIRLALGLDYGGIDFGLSRNGDVLLFEANATMVVEQPDADERWNYRREAVAKIHAAVREMLLTQSSSALTEALEPRMSVR